MKKSQETESRVKTTLTVSDTLSVTLAESDNPDEFMSLSSKVAVGNRAASCATLSASDIVIIACIIVCIQCNFQENIQEPIWDTPHFKI